jgi:hypothetical protein
MRQYLWVALVVGLVICAWEGVDLYANGGTIRHAYSVGFLTAFALMALDREVVRLKAARRAVEIGVPGGAA